VPMLAKANVESMQLPNLLQQPKMEMLPLANSHPPLPSVSNSVVPINADPMATLTPKPFEQNTQVIPGVGQFGQVIGNQPQDALASWPNNDTETEASTQGQKNFFKWESEEAL